MVYPSLATAACVCEPPDRVCVHAHVWRVNNNLCGDGEQIKGKGGRRIYSRGSFHRAADSWQHMDKKWGLVGGGGSPASCMSCTDQTLTSSILNLEGAILKVCVCFGVVSFYYSSQMNKSSLDLWFWARKWVWTQNSNNVFLYNQQGRCTTSSQSSPVGVKRNCFHLQYFALHNSLLASISLAWLNLSASFLLQLSLILHVIFITALYLRGELRMNRFNLHCVYSFFLF